MVCSLLECTWYGVYLRVCGMWYVVYLSVRGTEFTRVCVLCGLLECMWYIVYLSVCGTVFT